MIFAHECMMKTWKQQSACVTGVASKRTSFWGICFACAFSICPCDNWIPEHCWPRSSQNLSRSVSYAENNMSQIFGWPCRSQPLYLKYNSTNHDVRFWSLADSLKFRIGQCSLSKTHWTKSGNCHMDSFYSRIWTSKVIFMALVTHSLELSMTYCIGKANKWTIKCSAAKILPWEKFDPDQLRLVSQGPHIAQRNSRMKMKCIPATMQSISIHQRN